MISGFHVGGAELEMYNTEPSENPSSLKVFILISIHFDLLIVPAIHTSGQGIFLLNITCQIKAVILNPLRHITESIYFDVVSWTTFLARHLPC